MKLMKPTKRKNCKSMFPSKNVPFVKEKWPLKYNLSEAKAAKPSSVEESFKVKSFLNSYEELLFKPLHIIRKL